MDPLRLCLCQYDINWENADENRKHLTTIFFSIPQNSVDVIILPEMFTTGFSMNSKALAETMDGPSIQWMHEMAKQLNAAITGSVIIHENEKYYNRLLWIEPGNSQIKHYDKKHLFSLAGEQNHYEPGQNHLSLEWKGWKIAFFICYDLRFPVWSRNTENVDLMIYVANFPEKREKAWNSLLPARAIENQCFVAAVNRIGTDGNGIPHKGDSAVYDYEGHKILDLKQMEQLSFIEINHHSLEVYRRAYPFLKDRDGFKLSIEH
jgi:omega-amidase